MIMKMTCFALALIGAVSLAGCDSAKPKVAGGQPDTDSYLWLEEVEAPKALEWVRKHNATTTSELASSPRFRELEAELLDVLGSDQRIPTAFRQGDWYYNFWTDKQHPRGIWRRTTLAEYRKAEPAWEKLLDLDALNEAEGENWVWHHRAECLKPEYRRCLVQLSRGGSDATVTREFDIERKEWVKGGFSLPEAKGQLTWIDQDTVYATTDFGEGSLTESGYPRIVKEWKRGTPLDSAAVVFEGEPKDMAVSVARSLTPGFERDFIVRNIDFFTTKLYLRAADGRLTEIEVPGFVGANVQREWIFLTPREPWQVGGRTYPAGAYLAAKFDDYMAGKREFDVLFEPTQSRSLLTAALTRNHLVLTLLDDVKSRIEVLTHEPDGWKRTALKGLPENGIAWVNADEPDESDRIWVNVEDFLTPKTLLLADAGAPAKAPERVKEEPALFDASRHVVEQRFATSQDGTRVPYFLVRPTALAYDGKAPALLSGYGGFKISSYPLYEGSMGKAWLEDGGVYVLANIRGGGEYGPDWHRAALKQNRHKAYEDFSAVAKDLFEQKVTSPKHLGIRGISNGGLLTGNMLVQYPDLFGAVVIQVPLLDMKRYNKLLAGASWMAEYGNPDIPEEWAFIRKFSPYHLFDPKKDYPPALLLTSTRDDRVHPGHARKMFAKMRDAGKDVRYYENIEGGHGGAADNRQAAHMDALVYQFLWNQLAQ
jgi:prolyl oligopeptidase